MAKVKLKISRENKADVKNSFVLIDDRVLPFENADEINIFASTGKHGVTVVCIGRPGANTTAKIESTKGKVIEPLTAIVDGPEGIGHASDEFKVAAS